MDKLDLIYQMQHEVNKTLGKRDTINSEDKEQWLFDYAEALAVEVQELKDCINWKWWASEGKIDPYKKIINLKNAKIEAIDCLHFLVSIFQILDLDPDEILRIYKMKHEKNILRSKSNYSVLTKTEADNNEIMENL